MPKAKPTPDAATSPKPKAARKRTPTVEPVPAEIPHLPATQPHVDSNRRGDYDAYRDKQAQISRQRSAGGREIGKIPPPVDPARREAARVSLRVFAETYAAEQFSLEWSEDHLKAIARMEECILQGGLFALAMPRGSGKTTLSEVAAVWAVLNGYRRFVMIVAASSEKATEILDRIKTLIETSELLAADYPEVCVPVLKLEGIVNRAAGQTCEGHPTSIAWGKKQIILPTIAGSTASGAIIRVAGILGAVRGAKHLTDAGESLRPDLALVDDASTETSARSDNQNDSREKRIRRAVLRLAGPGQKIACFMLCTVIERGDLADRFLDRKKRPEWRGERCKLLYSFPTNEKLWDEYRRIRAEGLEKEDQGKAATAFYKKNRKAMDVGAKPGWEARYEEGELSAIQHCMNLWIEDPAGFLAEYNNEPEDLAAATRAEDLTDAHITAKIIPALPRLFALRDATRVTAMIDVQKNLLFYVVACWDEGFGGAVIDYGSYPEQPRDWYTAADASRTFSKEFPDLTDLSALLYRGLDELCAKLFGRVYLRHEGADGAHLSRCLIDANWGKSTNTVYEFCQRSAHGRLLLPSHGKGISSKQSPMDTWKTTPSDQIGQAWRITSAAARRGRHVVYDTNIWKSFIAARWRTAPGSMGSLGVFGPPTFNHRLFTSHMTSEYATETFGKGRRLEEWTLKPSRENHWFDCLTGSAVAAAIDGLKFSPAAASGVPIPQVTEEYVSFKQMQQEARESRQTPAESEFISFKEMQQRNR